jgi:hypothetical protein
MLLRGSVWALAAKVVTQGKVVESGHPPNVTGGSLLAAGRYPLPVDDVARPQCPAGASVRGREGEALARLHVF